MILEDLVKLANQLDEQGKYKIASRIDHILKKAIGDYPEYEELAKQMYGNSAGNMAEKNMIYEPEEIESFKNFERNDTSSEPNAPHVGIGDVVKVTKDRLDKDPEYQKLKSIRDNLNGAFEEYVSQVYIDGDSCYESASESVIEHIKDEKGVSWSKAIDIYMEDEQKYENVYDEAFEGCMEWQRESVGESIYESKSFDGFSGIGNEHEDANEVVKNLHDVDSRMNEAHNRKLQEVKKELGWKGP